MKLFKSSHAAIIEQCRYFFHVDVTICTASETLAEFFWGNAANDDMHFNA